MSSAEIVQSVAGAVYMATITAIGLRLIALARRNRALPELLLGISLLVGGTFGAAIEAAGMSGDAYFSRETAGALIGTGKAIGISGFTCQALFIRIVFRPDARWASALIALITLALLATFAAFFAVGAFSTGEMPLPIFLTEFAIRCVGSLWLVAESMRYYGAMRKRLTLGLADPLVTDRFRLIGVAAIAGLVLLATSLPPMIWPQTDGRWLELLIPLFAASGVAASAAFLLAFYPPRWYRAWVERRLAGSARSA